MNTDKINKMTCQILAYIYVICMIAILFFMKNGIDVSSDEKKEAYYIISAACLLPLFLSLLFSYINDKKKKSLILDNRIRLIYYFSLAYLCILIISGIFSEFSSEAFWGAGGWYTGILSLAIMIAAMILLSISLNNSCFLILALLTAASIISLFCILTRFSIDIFHMYDGYRPAAWYTYLPFLGQKNWYAAFMAIVYPISIGLLLVSKDKKITIFIAINFCIILSSLSLQGSDSIYVSMLFVLMFYFIVTIKDIKSFARYIYMLTLYTACLQITGLFITMFPDRVVSLSNSTYLITTSIYSHILFIFLCALSIILYFIAKTDKTYIQFIKIFKITISVLFALFLISLGLLVYIDSKYQSETPLYYILPNNFFVFDNNWGTNRGFNWKYAIKVFKESNILHKLIGIGPDCYKAYATKYHYNDFAIYWNQVVTNAHNEPLTALVNTGILGLITYYGIYVSSLICGIKNKANSPYIIPLCGAIIGSVFNNLFSFMTICSTSWMFIIIAFLIVEIKKSRN